MNQTPFEKKYLSRRRKKSPIDWLLCAIIGLAVVVAGMLVFAGIARASSVFQSDENKVQAVLEQCEAKVRTLI